MTGAGLLVASATLAVVHTFLGPDHVLPFVALARARKWSYPKTAAVTAICGLAHVLASVLISVAAVWAGFRILDIEMIGETRGSLAAWTLTAFGLAYCLWGIRKALRRRRGLSPHAHGDEVHIHSGGDADHQHEQKKSSRGTFWVLFIVFVLGPCEALIVLFVAPAMEGRWALAATSAAIYAVLTVATMLVLVFTALASTEMLRFRAFEPWAHALAGAIILASGLSVLFLGL